MMRKPSCLISCSHWPPEGSWDLAAYHQERHQCHQAVGMIRVFKAQNFWEFDRSINAWRRPKCTSPGPSLKLQGAGGGSKKARCPILGARLRLSCAKNEYIYNG